MKTKNVLALFLGVLAAVGFGWVAHAQMAGVTAPSVPTGVSAAMSASAQVSVSWTASTESSGTIEGYYIYRNGTRVAVTANTSFVDAGVAPGFYGYTIASYDANGAVSAQSSVVSVTLTIDTMPPTTPTGVTITGATSTNSFYATTPLTISWSASTDNFGVAGYQVYRNGTQIGPSTSTITGTSITDAVTQGTYTYAVAAYDAAQNYSGRSVPATVTVVTDNTSPSAPTNISVQQTSVNGVAVSWATSTDNIAVAGYQIYRNGIQIASAGGPPYADSGLSVGSIYNYAVVAYDEVGNVSTKSSLVTATIQPVTGLIPPYSLYATLDGTSTAHFSWSPAMDTLALTGYAIYRNGVQIASGTFTDYFDRGLVPGTYAYGVSATDVGGNVSVVASSTSAVVFVIAPSPTPTSTPMVVAPAPTPESAGSIPTSVTVLPAAISSSATSPSALPQNNSTFTQFLYFGLRSSQVQSLQSLLATNGYLPSVNITGFFGTITQNALEKFQCDQNIACTGNAGWGMVGPKTRSVLNGYQGSVAAPPSSMSSTAAMTAELEMLQAELANLEQQLSK